MEIKIAIATNINFYKHSLPIVLESLLNCGIEKTQIFVFNAGFPTVDIVTLLRQPRWHGARFQL